MNNEFKASFEDEVNRRFKPFLEHVKKSLGWPRYEMLWNSDE